MLYFWGSLIKGKSAFIPIYNHVFTAIPVSSIHSDSQPSSPFTTMCLWPFLSPPYTVTTSLTKLDTFYGRDKRMVKQFKKESESPKSEFQPTLHLVVLASHTQQISSQVTSKTHSTHFSKEHSTDSLPSSRNARRSLTQNWQTVPWTSHPPSWPSPIENYW